MFERFTQEARQVVVAAQENARALGHRSIRCEHLLLGVVSAGSSLADVLAAAGLTPQAMQEAARRLAASPDLGLDRIALAAIGVDVDEVRKKVEATFGPDALARPTPSRRRILGWWRRRTTGGHVPFTPAARKCLELSLREALALRHRHIGAEHILLALTRMDDAIVREILRGVGTSSSEVRAGLLHQCRRAS